MASKRKPAMKSQSWEDSIPFVNMLRKKTTPQSVKTSVKATAKTGKEINTRTRSLVTGAFGDPKKGWKDVAVTSGTWLIPYSKPFGAIDKVVKGGRVIKETGAAVRGAKGVRKVTKGTKAAVKATTKKTIRGAAKSGVVYGGMTASEKVGARIRSGKR